MDKQYIDPPSGWMYGFPKEFPDGVDDVNSWLVDNGYPKEEVELWGEHEVQYRITTISI